jgi:alkanesulfonate monooxygenase SsuD/methylene tetrahydromethanopterin reductase-like flavin-dependent oxidoreductase (luciferase family)
VNFDKIWSYPKPAQKPHPPILMGGDGPTTFDRVIEFCDGWMPIGIRSPNIPEKIADLRRRAEAAGRDPRALSVSIFGVKPDRSAIEEMAAAGVDRVIFMVPAGDREAVLPLIDKYAALIDQPA